jgi:hypothetical protein
MRQVYISHKDLARNMHDWSVTLLEAKELQWIEEEKRLSIFMLTQC